MVPFFWSGINNFQSGSFGQERAVLDIRLCGTGVAWIFQSVSVVWKIWARGYCLRSVRNRNCLALQSGRCRQEGVIGRCLENPQLSGSSVWKM